MFARIPSWDFEKGGEGTKNAFVYKFFVSFVQKMHFVKVTKTTNT